MCKLEGELAPEDDYWDVVAEVADWVIEIDATARKVRYAVIPTRRNAKELGAKGVQVRRCEVADDHPEPELGPFFQARILVREGSPTVDRARRAWLGRMSNVWVFMEGFRVLPYGEPTDDWLGIDAALARRERSLEFLSDLTGAPPPAEDEGLSQRRKDHYFGCVFLIQEKSRHLQMLVNREGFLPNDSFEALRTILRTGIDLSVRHAAAVKTPIRQQRIPSASNRRVQVERTRFELRAAVEQAARTASEFAYQARSAAAIGDIPRATELIVEAAKQFQAGSETHERLMSERQTMQILASLGLQMTALYTKCEVFSGYSEHWMKHWQGSESTYDSRTA